MNLLTQSDIDRFIALVTDGQPINEYDPPCLHCGERKTGPLGHARKQLFLHLGQAVLRSLAVKLGCFGVRPDGSQWVNYNEGGPVVSGSVYLLHPKYSVSFFHPSHLGFSFYSPGQYANARSGPQWGQQSQVGGWLPWGGLRDLRACARKVEEWVAAGKTYADSRHEREEAQQATRVGQVGAEGTPTLEPTE